MPGGRLPPGAAFGYVYDWLRQRQRKAEEEKKRRKKLRKKIKRLSKGRKRIRRRESHKTATAMENVKNQLEGEKKHPERIR